MYIIREVFRAKPGQASKLAKLFKKSFSSMPSGRVMTDMVGDFNTVVMEMEVASLAEWEKEMADYKAGKVDPNMDKETLAEMAAYTDMFFEGRREIFQIME